MTYFSTHVEQLHRRLYPKDYLTRHVIKAKHFIDIHYSEAINLNRIAREAHVSKYHFIRLFKFIYGCTPHQYLTDVRMKQAKAILKDETPIADVCIAVGFESVPSFTRIFKKMTGTTPSRFQNLNGKSNFG